MSVIMDEFLIPSFLNLNLKFFSAEKQFRKFRRRKKPLVGTILPLGAEFVFAAGAAPIFPLRMGKFEAEKLLKATRLATNILGSTLVGAGSKMLQPQAERIIKQFLSEYNKNLSAYEEESDKRNYLPEVCFATRMAYGSALPYQDRIQLFLAWGTRCTWFSQLFQTLHDDIPIIFTDIPIPNPPHTTTTQTNTHIPTSTHSHVKDYMYEELQKLIKHLESLTGNGIQDVVLREKIQMANEIKANYRQILYYLKEPTKMPLSPYAYTQLLAMLTISFVDYLSAIKYFNKNLSKLIKELNTRKKIDYSDVPKILLLPVFSGSEPALPQIINDLGGCLIQADNLAYKMLDPIKTEGDLIENYGEYLLNSQEVWSSSKNVVASWINLAKDLKVDGVVFNKLIGCTTLTPAYRLFKDEISELDIPSTVIDFNRIGENLAQLKNKLGSFIEIIKNK